MLVFHLFSETTLLDSIIASRIRQPDIFIGSRLNLTCKLCLGVGWWKSIVPSLMTVVRYRNITLSGKLQKCEKLMSWLLILGIYELHLQKQQPSHISYSKIFNTMKAIFLKIEPNPLCQHHEVNHCFLTIHTQDRNENLNPFRKLFRSIPKI